MKVYVINFSCVDVDDNDIKTLIIDTKHSGDELLQILKDKLKEYFVDLFDDDDEFEALESENIKNKGILSDSKRLLEESNTNILQALKNAQEWFKISLIDISHLNDDVEIKKVIDLCVNKILLTKDGNVLNLNIESVFGLNYYFQYNIKTKEIKFLDEPIKLIVSVRYKSKRKRG